MLKDIYLFLLGLYSHAEGNSSEASGDYSHAEGFFTIANSDYSHAEGYQTQVNGVGGHGLSGLYTMQLRCKN
jgi:hypothetical protein